MGTPLIDIPTGWDPQAKQQQRVALAVFSAAPWQGFEKSERGPNNSSLFQPQAAVVVVALWLCLRHKCRRLVRGLLPRTKRNRYKMGTPLIDIPIDWDPQAKQQPTGLIACGINAAALFEVPSLAQKEKPAHDVYWFLVRGRGLEPPRINHTHLKRARLPVPPPSHTVLFSQP